MILSTIDETRLENFLGRFTDDLGAVFHAATVLIGDRLGLYRALDDTGPVTAADFARHAGGDERYLTEWLSAQAAAGYVEYDPDSHRFWLAPEQALALTSDENPMFAPGGFQVAASTIRDIDMLTDAIGRGEAVPWDDHHDDLFEATDRFFKPNYIGNLVDGWLPELDGAIGKLTSGASVADVGCGYGAADILMARAFPNSTFVGFDLHPPSVEAANDAAAMADVADRCTFQVSAANRFPGTGYDLVTFFDCLHDMGDPVEAATHVRESLAQDGSWMIVEPAAGDRLEDNLNPVGRLFYACSTLICVPVSRSQPGDAALGAQAGEARTRQVARAAGFGSFRRVATTPFNHVYEARQ